MKTIEQKIRDIVEKVTGEKPDDTTPLIRLGCDSLDILEIEMELEKEFDIDMNTDSFDSTERMGFMSIHDIVCLVEYEYLGAIKKENE